MADSADLLISVVICTYNRPALLRAAIDSVLTQNLTPGRFEIIVVNNSPDQAAAARAGEAYRGVPRLTYLLEAEAGASNARNAGAAKARAPLIAFLDDDERAEKDWLGAVLDAFAGFPRSGIVGGRVRLTWTSERPGWLHDRLLDYLSLVDWGGACRVRAKHEWFSSGNMAIKAEAWRAVGGFSRGLGRSGAGAALLSNEDLDVTDRIEAQGFAAVYAPDAVVEHAVDPARLTPAWFRRRAAWQAVSDFLSHGGPPPRAGDAAARLRMGAQSRKECPPGFFTEKSDPMAIFMDTQIAYYLVLAMLEGGVDVDAKWIEQMRRMSDSGSKS